MESAVVRNLSSKISKQTEECRGILSRVERKEGMVCDYVDIVRESNALTRQQYTATIYTSTLCKEITKASLSVLEAALCILHDVHTDKSIGAQRNDDMADSVEPQGGFNVRCCTAKGTISGK